REAREISPQINSSATRSPSTVNETLGKAGTIFLRWPASLVCFVILENRICDWMILSFSGHTFFNLAQHGIQDVSCILQLHFYRDHGQRFEGRKIGAKIDCVFLGSHKAPGFASLLQGKEFANVAFGVGVVIAIKGFGDGINIGGAQLQDKVLRSRDAAEDDGALRDGSGVFYDQTAADAPERFAGDRKRIGGSATGENDRI